MAPSCAASRKRPRPFLYREFPAYGGQQSVRLGDWKAVRKNLLPKGKRATPDLTVELYNLASDGGETRNVARENPQIIEKIMAIMRREHSPSVEFPFAALDGP